MKITNKNRHFWQFPSPLYENDVKEQLDGFETFDDSSAEIKKRIRSLLSEGGRKQRLLAKKLRRCHKTGRCNSAACPKCFRGYRRWLFSQVLRIFRGKKDVFVTTLIFTKLRLSKTRLFKIKPHSMKETLSKQLERSGLGHILAIGGIEADFDVETQKWEPHIHLISYGCSEEELNALRHYYKAVPEVKRPMVVQEAEDPVEQFSYCRKSYFARKEKFFDKNGNKIRVKHRLRPYSLHNMSLLYLDQFSPNDLLFLRNIRREGNELSVKCVGEKSL